MLPLFRDVGEAYSSTTFRVQLVITMLVNFGVNFGIEYGSMSALQVWDQAVLPAPRAFHAGPSPLPRTLTPTTLRFAPLRARISPPPPAQAPGAATPTLLPGRASLLCA